jgi:hypothetical protein
MRRARSSASNATIKSDYETVRYSDSTQRSGHDTPPPVPRLPPKVPGRSPSRLERVSPLSPRYDNGTGELDPQLIRDNRLPSHVKTTKDLYEHQKVRRSQQVNQSDSRRSGEVGSIYSASSYSNRDSVASYRPGREPTGRPATLTQSFDVPRPLNIRKPGAVSLEIPRSKVHMTPANPMIRGLRSMYTARAVSHVLPGATRRNRYAGYYLHRGTLRDIPGETAESRGWWKKKKKKATKGAAAGTPAAVSNVETSGWYSD